MGFLKDLTAVQESAIHHSYNGVGFVRFSFAGTDGAGLIITKNEEIT